MEERVELEESEANMLRNYQKTLDEKRLVVAAMRQRYLRTEKNAFEDIEKCEQDLTLYIKMLAKNKNIPENENWGFDIQNFVFVKADEK